VGRELQVEAVVFSLDGEIRCITNAAPYQWEWDPAEAEPGEHQLRVAVSTPDGDEVEKVVSVVVAPR